MKLLLKLLIRITTAFTAHCRPRSCGRQRAVTQPSNDQVNERMNYITKKSQHVTHDDDGIPYGIRHVS